MYIQKYPILLIVTENKEHEEIEINKINFETNVRYILFIYFLTFFNDTVNAIETPIK